MKKSNSTINFHSKLIWLSKLYKFKVVEEYLFDINRKFRIDFFLPEFNVGIEYEGIIASKSRHTTVDGFSKDCQKYNLATIAGIRILRYTALNEADLHTDLQKIGVEAIKSLDIFNGLCKDWNPNK